MSTAALGTYTDHHLTLQLSTPAVSDGFFVRASSPNKQERTRELVACSLWSTAAATDANGTRQSSRAAFRAATPGLPSRRLNLRAC